MECDALIIGAGPAGLTAGVYLGRYRRRVIVADGGPGRASLIPLSHNMAGFPDGLSGPDLLARMRAHSLRYGAEIVPGVVTGLERDGAGFAATLDGRPIRARGVIMATGVADIEPALPDLVDAIARGLIRHCPVCDGYEVIGQRVAVIGFGASALREALFLRTWSDDVTLLTLGQPASLTAEEALALAKGGVAVVVEPVIRVMIVEGRLTAVVTASGVPLAFDTLYSALGARSRSDLALSLGCEADEAGILRTDQRGETCVPGLFAAGDVSSGLNQVAVATGQAAIAATAIHRRLLGFD
ncbi:MAG: NAD(P)/FAD-dependent oxidoreductase [Alphaproteobacteria bacterium]|nr:NAD(P)/FAD-dependent oxidoreductase [Alphaproteobacteria bacterium]